MTQAQDIIALPKPHLEGKNSLERLLAQRRSTREYHPYNLQISEIGQLLWAAQGFTHEQGYRTAPSAGALYPLELYLIAGTVDGLVPGVYRYFPNKHQLEMVDITDQRKALAQATFGQSWVKEASIVVVFAALYERTTQKYGERGIRYVHMEAGHAAQNLFLQAEALGMGTVVVGAFDDRKVSKAIRLSPDIVPLSLMPVGRK